MRIVSVKLEYDSAVHTLKPLIRLCSAHPEAINTVLQCTP